MDKKKNKVLVPVDYSEVSTAAIEHAIIYAKKTNAELNLLNVIEKRPVFIGRNKEYENKLIEEGAISKLKQIAADIETKHNIEVEIIVVPGNIFDTINSVAHEISADFVVMGTHGLSGWQYLFGSNALKVIYHSTVPYILTQKRAPIKGDFDNILFPIDIHRETVQKTSWAIYFHKIFGSTINILEPTEPDEYRAKKIAYNLSYVKRAFTRHNVDFVVHKSDLDVSSLAEETNRFAEELSANLIMIMIYPSKGTGEFFLTPIQQNVISNKAQIPVVCINPGTVFMLEDNIEI